MTLHSQRVAQGWYIIISAFCIAAISASGFSTTWIRNTSSSGAEVSLGFFPWPCIGMRAQVCSDYWNATPSYYHVTFISLMSGLLLSSVVFILQTFAMCGIRSLVLFLIIAMLSLLNVAALTLSVTLFGIKTKLKTTVIPPIGQPYTQELYYSFWIAVGAAVLAAALTILSLLIPFLGGEDSYTYDLSKAQREYDENMSPQLVREDTQRYSLAT